MSSQYLLLIRSPATSEPSGNPGPNRSMNAAHSAGHTCASPAIRSCTTLGTQPISAVLSQNDACNAASASSACSVSRMPSPAIWSGAAKPSMSSRTMTKSPVGESISAK